MALNNIRVNLELDRIHVHDEGDGLGSAEPYLWSVFFKVDGETIQVTDALRLSGRPIVHTTPGSHGNLGNRDADEGDIITIPEAVGEWSTTMQAIPSSSSVGREFGGVVGVIVVMMEEDNVSDDGAEAGHAGLDAAVRAALQRIIDTRTITNQDVTEEEINQLTAAIGSAVEAAIVNQQNVFENLWSWLNPDDQIGSKVFMFTHDELNAGTTKTFSQRWRNEGDWEIFGHVTSTVACPVEASRALIEELMGGDSASMAQAASKRSTSKRSTSKRSVSASKRTVSAAKLARVSKSMGIDISPMRRFRDNEYRRYPGLGAWFALAARNAPRLAFQVVQKRELAVSLRVMLEWGNSIATDPNAKITDHQVENAERILVALEATRSREVRIDARRARGMLAQLRGKTNLEALVLLDRVEPARHPRMMGTRLSRASMAEVFKRRK